jgi:transcriptional regulator with XRE-family HTH domain
MLKVKLIKNDSLFLIKLGERIVQIRKSKKLKQYELSDLLSMDDSGLRKIESGRTNPTIKTLIRIANALEIEFIELFKFKEKDKIE